MNTHDFATGFTVEQTPPGEGGDVVEGEAALAVLQSAERRDVDARARRDLLQGQAAGGAQLAQPPADAQVEGLLGAFCRHGM